MYISGAISNPDREVVKKNIQRFNEKEVELEKMGWDVFNPARLEVKGGASWEYYLARDLAWMFEHKPTLYMLEGWEESRGARLEYETAKLLNLNICFEVLTSSTIPAGYTEPTDTTHI